MDQSGRLVCEIGAMLNQFGPEHKKRERENGFNSGVRAPDRSSPGQSDESGINLPKSSFLSQD